MVKLIVEVLNVPVNQMGRFLWKGVDYPEVRQTNPPVYYPHEKNSSV